MRKNQGGKSCRVINKSHAVIVAADRCNTSPGQHDAVNKREIQNRLRPRGGGGAGTQAFV